MVGACGVLGQVDVEEFLQVYWQRQPLMIRQALPEYSAPVSGNELAGLALDADVESRIVVEQDEPGRWELRHGPFSTKDFRCLPESNWTLLVQGLDLWNPGVANLLGSFDFLPRWRLDDVMASYAVPGGSVGPHFDRYDVFLLQVEGERRWQIGDRCSVDTPLLPDTDLEILADFKVVQEWILQAGDMLYLPPCIAHWGVALTPGMTFSVGFRSPSLADLLGDLAMEMAAAGHDQYYRDPPLTEQLAGEQIAPVFIEQVRRSLLAVLDDDALLSDWFARFMTQPKYPGLESATGEKRRARIGRRLYENGERIDY